MSPPKVVCFGDGDQFELLSNYLKLNKLEHIVSLKGMVSIGELQSFMLAADLVAMPSLWESFGQVVVGAMALGKPVLGSDTGGIREQITHNKTGFLVSPGDADSWSFEIENLMNSRTLLLTVGRAARESISNKMTPVQIVSRLIDYYRTL